MRGAETKKMELACHFFLFSIYEVLTARKFLNRKVHSLLQIAQFWVTFKDNHNVVPFSPTILLGL
jgi:hypothetical protein